MNYDSADDLIVEENEDVIKALQRLSPQESYDRVYRIRRAMQCSLSHKLLPKEEQTKPEEVRPPVLLSKREVFPTTCCLG
jgi:ubiquinol-cytochrome c reductase subunit 7